MTSLPFLLAPDTPPPGFTFNNCLRNEKLKRKGFLSPEPMKTGTTIAGLVYKDGVILGADTRATEAGKIVADKNCQKIFQLASKTYCCGAGTAADTMNVTRMIQAQLTLMALHTGRPTYIVNATTLLKRLLYRYSGEVYAALIVGGVDSDGPHVHSMYPHGSTDQLPYATLGSGAHAAMAVLEARWKSEMGESAAKSLLKDAILAGILNDLGSGSNVDLCVIRREGLPEVIRGYVSPNERGAKLNCYKFPRGATGVLRARVVPLDVEFERTRHVQRLLPPRPRRCRSHSPGAASSSPGPSSQPPKKSPRK